MWGINCRKCGPCHLHTSSATRLIVVHEPAGPGTSSDRYLQLMHTPYYRNRVTPSCHRMQSSPLQNLVVPSIGTTYTPQYQHFTLRPTYSGYREKHGHIHSHTHRPTTVTLAAHTCRQGQNTLYENVPNCCKKYLASTSVSVFLLLMKFDRSPPLQYSIIKKM